METCFEVKDLNLYYGEKQALKQLNLTIGKNRVTGADRSFGVWQIDVSAVSEPDERSD